MSKIRNLKVARGLLPVSLLLTALALCLLPLSQAFGVEFSQTIDDMSFAFGTPGSPALTATTVSDQFASEPPPTPGAAQVLGQARVLELTVVATKRVSSGRIYRCGCGCT